MSGINVKEVACMSGAPSTTKIMIRRRWVVPALMLAGFAVGLLWPYVVLPG